MHVIKDYLKNQYEFACVVQWFNFETRSLFFIELEFKGKI